jgi:pilus assembly protein CpaB
VFRVPSRSVWGIAALVLGLVTAASVAGDLAALHRRAARLGPPRPVVTAARDLPLGIRLTADDLTVVHLHEPPPGALPARPLPVGRVVAVPVLQGMPLSRRHLVSRRSGPGGHLPVGTRAVRVAVEHAPRLHPGAVVDVLVTPDPETADDPGPGAGGSGLPQATTAVAGALVLETGAGHGTGDDGGRPATRPEVTLLVTLDDAPRLASAASRGTLTLALAPPEDACCRRSLLDSSRD